MAFPQLLEITLAHRHVRGFPIGLNTATNRLCGALGDSGGAPCYIDTVPRLGYRFICPVSSIPREAPASAIAPTAPQPSRPYRPLSLVAIALAIALAFAYIHLNASAPAHSRASINIDFALVRRATGASRHIACSLAEPTRSNPSPSVSNF